MKLLVQNSSAQEDTQPTSEQIAAYSKRLLADNNLMRLKITVEALDPITKSGLEFFAGRAGRTIEEYCLDAVLAKLECDECDREDRGHFGRIQSEVTA